MQQVDGTTPFQAATKQLQAAMKAVEGSRILGQTFVQPVEVMEGTLSNSLNQMDGVSSKQYYEGLVSVIGEDNLDETFIEEENVINVISDSKFKSVCYRLTMVLLIVAFSSTLTDQEIQGVWKLILELLTLVGGVKAVMPAPVQKEEHHHHHHHYHHKDE
uniref:hypothetical protein n=1 Tax=Bacillus cereus group sp. BfR-BA-01319 TaxID=2920296 RepID=UPI001F59A472